MPDASRAPHRPLGNLTAADLSIFVSPEVTGNGSAQSTAHGLGRTPTVCIAWITELPDAAAETGFDIAAGTHTSTNAIFTVTNTVKYQILAL